MWSAATGRALRWLLPGLLLGYVVARAGTMSITYDEATTWYWHVPGTIGQIVAMSTPGQPDNNHVLLTLLAKLSLRLFGDSELALRLPSVAAFALYCGAVAAILRRWLDGALLILFFLFATLNPEIIDMMSIARGYGLAIALATAGVYCLLRAAEPDGGGRVRWVWLAMIAAALAVLAHLSLLLFYGLTVAIIAVVVLADRRMVWRSAIAVAVVSLLLAAIVLPEIRILHARGLFDTEGLTSFFVDTVHGSIVDSLRQDSAWQIVLDALTVFVYGVPVCGLIVLMRRGPARRDLAVVLTLLLGVSMLSIAQHHVGEIAYLSGRRATSLYPLFVLVCAGVAASCAAGPWPLRRLMLPVLVAVPALLIVQFARSMDLHATRAWAYDADTRTMLPDLMRLAAASPGHPLRLGIEWMFYPAITYYRNRDHITAFGPVTSTSPDHPPYDAYYIFAGTVPAMERVVGPLRILRRYDDSGTVLAIPADSPLANESTQ